jgi:hypothetical protein
VSAVVILGFLVLAGIGLGLKVFKDRDVTRQRGFVLFGLLLVAAAAQLLLLRHYDANLNTLSIICTIAFFVMYGRDLSRRASGRLKDGP